jgi:hypothetical protein
MRRCLLFAAAFLTIGPAAPQEAPDPGRFEINPSQSGFTRLDTRTGAVAHCSRGENGVWFCEPLDNNADVQRLEELAATLSELSDGLGNLAERVDMIAGRLDAMPSPPMPDTAAITADNARQDQALARIAGEMEETSARIAELTTKLGETAALAVGLDQLTARVDDLSTPPDVQASLPAAPAAVAVRQSPGFADELMRRLHDLVRTLKGDGDRA